MSDEHEIEPGASGNPNVWLERTRKKLGIVNPPHPQYVAISDSECRHPKCQPLFDEESANKMTADEVRKRWPRFEGVCPDCGVNLINYASAMHYICGDY